MIPRLPNRLCILFANECLQNLWLALLISRFSAKVPKDLLICENVEKSEKSLNFQAPLFIVSHIRL